MATTATKPRGRPPADGNFIVWSESLVESLLRLRFEKYAGPMTAARGTKALRQAWAELADELTQQNNGGVVSVEQCRNKLKALKNKWLAYRSGLVSEPVGFALMDAFWGSEKDDSMTITSPVPARPSPEHQKHVKKPRLMPKASTSGVEEKSLSPIAIAPAPISAATPVSAGTPTRAEVTALSSAPASTTAEHDTVVITTELVEVAGQGLTDITPATADTARAKITPSLEKENMSKLEKLIDDRFAKVLERQEKQLKLTERQNELLERLFETLASQ